MATITFYSDSEEFLQGVVTGIEFVNDGSIDVIGEVSSSDDPNYDFQLRVDDEDTEDDEERYFDGSAQR